MRDSFIFYRSFFETIKKIPKKDRLQLVEAICDYALNENEVSLSGVNAAIFEMVKPQIDANSKRYENGKKGGRPKKPNQNQTETKTKPNHNQTITKTKPNVNVNVNVNDNVNVNGSGSEIEPSEPSPSVIIKYLNFKTGAEYDPESPESVELISDLIDQGYEHNDFMKVINNKCSDWMNDSTMRSYLRPSTLFGPKFPEYLAAPESVQAETERKKTDEMKSYQDLLDSKRNELVRVQADLSDPELEEDAAHNINSRYYKLKDQEAILMDAISRLETRLSAGG